MKLFLWLIGFGFTFVYVDFINSDKSYAQLGKKETFITLAANFIYVIFIFVAWPLILGTEARKIIKERK